MPTAEDFQRMYTPGAYHDEHYAELTDVPRESLDAVARFVSAGATMLDLGCGNGRFLHAARLAGYRAHGVELDSLARKQAADNSGCDVLSLDEVFDRDLKYDVIHLGDVLEHLPDPAEVMRRLEGALRLGGVFLLEGPLEENRSLVGWAARVVRHAKAALGRPSYAAMPPTHLTRTTAKSQRDFFTSRLGHEVLHFEVKEDGWPYLPLSWTGPAPRGIRPTIGRAAIRLSSAANRFGLGVGNRFIAVTRPRD